MRWSRITKNPKHRTLVGTEKRTIRIRMLLKRHLHFLQKESSQAATIRINLFLIKSLQILNRKIEGVIFLKQITLKYKMNSQFFNIMNE
jgi:hypothetical protein